MNKSRFIRFSFLFAAARVLTVLRRPSRWAAPVLLRDSVSSRGHAGRQRRERRTGPLARRNSQLRGLYRPGECGVPNDGTVKAVTLNITVVNPTSLGHLTAFPYITAVPVVPTISYGAGEPALGNGAIVPITNDNNLQISILPVLSGPGNTVHAIIDITGYFK